MSKRKADELGGDEPHEKRGPSTAAADASSSSSNSNSSNSNSGDPAAPAAAAATSSSALFPADADSRIAAVYLAQQRARVSNTFAVLLRNRSNQSSLALLTAVAKELAEDSQRAEALIDFSHKNMDGDSLLTLLIETLVKHTRVPPGASAADVEEKKAAAAATMQRFQHLLKLVRASSGRGLPTSKLGEPALCLLCRLTTPSSIMSWPYVLAEALLQAGGDANSRDTKGWTPLLRWAAYLFSSACGPLLLLRHGSDINALDPEGRSTLHLLVHSVRQHKKQVLPALREFAESGYLARADHLLLNNRGETALQTAQALVKERPDDEAALELLETLHAQSELHVSASVSGASANASAASAAQSSLAAANIVATAMAQQRAACSIRLCIILRNLTKRSVSDVVRTLCAELAADAARAEPLIHLAQTLAVCYTQGGGTLLTLLIEVLREHTSASKHATQQQRDAYADFQTQLPHFLKLVRSADPSVKSKDGETPLSLLCRLFVPLAVDNTSFLLAEALLDAGANTEEPDKFGRTPLLAWTRGATDSACGPLMLLRRGANLEAQHSGDGSAMLHALVMNAREHKATMLPALRELAESGYLPLANFAQVNKAGATALIMAVENRNDDAAAELVETLHFQSTLWHSSIRPITLALLSHACLLPDLAEVVLAYVDGGLRPSEQAAAAPEPMDIDAADEGEAASAAAAGADPSLA